MTRSVTGCEEAREVEAQKHPREFLTPRSLGRRGHEATKGGSRVHRGGAAAECEGMSSPGLSQGRKVGKWLRTSDSPEKEISRKGLPGREGRPVRG